MAIMVLLGAFSIRTQSCQHRLKPAAFIVMLPLMVIYGVKIFKIITDSEKIKRLR
jgi:hypothetical protein